jgi:hypothetical protein
MNAVLGGGLKISTGDLPAAASIDVWTEVPCAIVVCLIWEPYSGRYTFTQYVMALSGDPIKIRVRTPDAREWFRGGFITKSLQG